MPAYDYVSSGLIGIPLPQHPKVRRETEPRFGDPHAWYHHETTTYNAFMNRDESVLLYNTALKFSGKMGLEIGSAACWSAWHILAAGVKLALVDPIFAENLWFSEGKDFLAEYQGRCECTSIPSPAGAIDMGRRHSPFSLVLIDGNHDAPNPLVDAAAVIGYCADDAIVMLHDCWNPGVHDALALFKAWGWETGIYCTSGLLGVAWRGAVEPVKHVADPALSDFHDREKLPQMLWLS